MKFTSFLGFAAFLTSTTALPNKPRQASSAVVVFDGAAGASYSLTVPLNGQTTYTNNALSISTISSSIDIPLLCTLQTVDYTPSLAAIGPSLWAVGPPQTVNSITCSSGSTPPANSITIEFDGADPDQGAKYTLTVPLDGSTVATNNALSISTLVSTFAALQTNCYFNYVDYQAALVLISANIWAVGPPQTITSVSCHA